MARIFEVVTDEYHPQTGELILGEDKILDALSHKSIKEYAYILHDSDRYVSSSFAR